jgi:hypothetical protein
LRDVCDVIHWLREGQLVKNVRKEDFDGFEKAMKENNVQDKIDRLAAL